MMSYPPDCLHFKYIQANDFQPWQLMWPLHLSKIRTIGAYSLCKWMFECQWDTMASIIGQGTNNGHPVLAVSMDFCVSFQKRLCPPSRHLLFHCILPFLQPRLRPRYPCPDCSVPLHHLPLCCQKCVIIWERRPDQDWLLHLLVLYEDSDGNSGNLEPSWSLHLLSGLNEQKHDQNYTKLNVQKGVHIDILSIMCAIQDRKFRISHYRKTM